MKENNQSSNPHDLAWKNLSKERRTQTKTILMKSVSGSSSWTCNSITRNCHHNIQANLRTVKKGRNLGRKFFGCSLWPNADCRYFEWYNDNEVECHDEYKLMDKDIAIERLLAEKKLLEEKLQKIENKKKKMCVLITEMQMKASKSAKGERA
ncbi:unnamed protein product, partial [Cuscuta europaea]